MCVTVAATSHRHNTSYHQKTGYHQKTSHRHKTSHRQAPGYVLRLHARRSVLGIVGICGLLSGVIYPAEAAADTGPVVLAAEVARSLIQHPEVSEANARVCQAIHRLGLSKAEARPKLDLSISGGRQEQFWLISFRLNQCYWRGPRFCRNMWPRSAPGKLHGCLFRRMTRHVMAC